MTLMQTELFDALIPFVREYSYSKLDEPHRIIIDIPPHLVLDHDKVTSFLEDARLNCYKDNGRVFSTLEGFIIDRQIGEYIKSKLEQR
jgi:hypothetical protein